MTDHRQVSTPAQATSSITSGATIVHTDTVVGAGEWSQAANFTPVGAAEGGLRPPAGRLEDVEKPLTSSIHAANKTAWARSSTQGIVAP
jgi:hypothetical protein